MEELADGTPSSRHAAESGETKITAKSAGLTLAKSLSGRWRNIGREVLPSFNNGVLPPAAKLNYGQRAAHFVPIPHYAPEQSRSRVSLSAPSLSTRGQPFRPQSIDANQDSLEEFFEDRAKRDLPLPYLDMEQYDLISKSKRKVPENISGPPGMRASAHPTRGDESGDGPDERPDFIRVDPSRIPNIAAMSHLPKPADIKNVTNEVDPDRPRLWRNSPIILKRTNRNQR